MGHIHYAKSARLYLQQMLELDTKFPWVNHEAEGALPPERIYYSIPPLQRIQNMIHKIRKNGNNDSAAD